MANVAGHQTIAAPTSLEKVYRKVQWDFSEDGGATGDLGLFTADGDVLVTDFYYHVETTVTSATTGDVSFGVTDATTAFENAASTGASGIAAGTVVREDAITDLPVKLEDGDQVTMSIGTAALTAGKITVCIGIMKSGL